ncbi:hypothetical protein OAC85_03080, partial [Flavobacteriaceae bacterium]|nr:hypothetical protein [Flavobacteriaceae bacterium]
DGKATEKTHQTDEKKLDETHKKKPPQDEVSLTDDQKFKNSINGLFESEQKALIGLFENLSESEKKELVAPTKRSVTDRNGVIINVANSKYLDRSLKKILNANHGRDREVQFQHLRKGIITKIYIQESTISGNKDIEVKKKGEDFSLFKAPSIDRNKKKSFSDTLIRIVGGFEKILGPKK